jgi:hypothetical protein
MKISEIELDIVTSTLSTLELSWPELTTHEETGGSPIQSYNLQIFNGATWTDIQGHDGALSISTESSVLGLTSNTYYTFRVSARNVQGWSLEWSEEFTFITAIKPATPLEITTTLVN